MSRIKDLKNNSSNNGNIINVISKIFPDLKTKYIELYLELTKNSEFMKNITKEVENMGDYSIDDLNPFEIFMLYEFRYVYNIKDTFDTFKTFCEYNENGQIKNNDLTKIKNFETIEKEVNIVDLKNISKDMTSQVIKLYEDNEWLMIKPLTIMAARKYGSNTKWCVTSKDSYDYFLDYAGRGTLIYSLNKLTGYKVATFRSIKGKEFSFWDEKDNRIDALDCDLPMELLKIIREECRSCKLSNRDLISKEDIEKEFKLFGNTENKKEYPIPLVGNNHHRIRVADAEEAMEGDQEVQYTANVGLDPIETAHRGVDFGAYDTTDESEDAGISL